MADHGTIVFNEVDKLQTKSQAIVLRFLQNKTTERLGSNKQIPIDARVIATSHQDLKAAVREGRFRDDLYEYPAEYPVLWTGMNAERGQGGCNPPHCLSRCPAL
jgi:DNA-binding NtrC family response regulator